MHSTDVGSAGSHPPIQVQLPGLPHGTTEPPDAHGRMETLEHLWSATRISLIDLRLRMTSSSVLHRASPALGVEEASGPGELGAIQSSRYEGATRPGSRPPM